MMIILAEFMGGKPVGDRVLVVAVVTPFEMAILHTLYAKLFTDKRQHVDFHLVLHYWGILSEAYERPFRKCSNPVNNLTVWQLPNFLN